MNIMPISTNNSTTFGQTQIPPEVEHWHGAAPHSMFAHISVETNLPDNETTWLKPVSDEEYK